MKRLTCVLAVALAMGFVCAIAYADLADGLVGYWSFDTGTAKDDSGTGNKGTILGNPRLVDGKVGKAFDFDGDGDGIDIASNPTVELPNAFTAACWIYPRATKDAAGNDHAGVFWKGSLIGWGTDVYNYRIATVDDAGLTFGACGGGVESHFKNNCLVDGFDTWYHVAYTADGSIGIGYVNGVEVGNREDAISYDVVADQPVRIGWSQGRGGDINTLVYFDGIIDEVVLYNRALSVAEIAELMQQGLPATAVKPAAKLATTWSRIKAY